MRSWVFLAATLALAGCGARSSTPAVAATSAPLPDARTRVAASAGAASTAPLSDFMAKVRELTAAARPPRQGQPARVEDSDPRLSAALLAVHAERTPTTLRALALEYRRLGIFDRAHEYLQQALALDPFDGSTYEALARVWRDGGLPGLALGDAYRAVYHAPDSAAARNTLGTVLQALGRHADAREQYERAVRLDPAASYALNNLCYAWMLDGSADKAEAACKAALALQPELRVARNNLGLVYASRGHLADARAAFAAAGDPAATEYNIGIVQMARRNYADAVSAFVAAQRARPSLHLASRRARQALQLARSGAGE